MVGYSPDAIGNCLTGRVLNIKIMIYKSKQLGKHKIILAEFGEGDIAVDFIYEPSGLYTGITLKNTNKYPIGHKNPEDIGKTTDESKPDIMLSFTKTESIDVVIRALKKAKHKFKTLSLND